MQEEGQPRILFVDDDAAVRRVFNRDFKSDRYELDVADGVEAAMSMVAEQQYAVVVTDYNMPGADGLELITRIRATQSKAKYIMLTGSRDQDVAFQAVATMRVVHFIHKPWDTDRLRSILDYWTGDSEEPVPEALKESKPD